MGHDIFQNHFAEINTLINQSRQKAMQVVNTVLIDSYLSNGYLKVILSITIE
jgi:hypothetical protein